jgi:multidrug efflux pump subunit AcrB
VSAGLIRWFVHNPIAANILMLALLLGGMMSFDGLKKEVFPQPDSNFIQITMAYPGASPGEVEQQIVIRIEEAIANLPGIFQIISESREGIGVVNVEVVEGYDVMDALNNIKSRVDSIITFPEAAERPIVQHQLFRDTLMWFSISGNADMATFKQLGYRIRDEMPLLEGISEVRVVGMVPDEVAIEITETDLRRYNLSFTEVARAIRHSSVNVPAGLIKSPFGNVQIQTREQAYGGEDFSEIVIRSYSDGSELRLGDIAEIRDAYAEEDMQFILNDRSALNFEVKISDDPNLFGGTANANAYLDELREGLPEGLVLRVGYEAKSMFDDRFSLLQDNALMGLFLVYLILMLFLRPLLAFWVVVGIGTAFSGAIWFMQYYDISLNMLSMFAFLMVLGIVVDDAIIVGESIFRRQEPGRDGRDLAVEGTLKVLMPVTLAVVSTIIFFVPLLDVPDAVKSGTYSIFFVVFFCLIFSLVESLLILPAHLSHIPPEREDRESLRGQLTGFRLRFSNGMQNFATQRYQPLLRKVLEKPVSTVLFFVMFFLCTVALFASGRVGSAFFPTVPQPYINIDVEFPEGSPFRYSTDLVAHMKKQAELIKADEELLARNGGREFIFEINTTALQNTAGMFVGLTPVEERAVSAEEITDRLRELIGPVPEAKSYSLDFSFGFNAPDIQLELNISSNRLEHQRSAVEDIQRVLAAYPGVTNVRSNLDTGRQEIEVRLKPFAETVGITTADIAEQLRQAFYGEEVQRIPRSKEDVKVMLRYSAEERRSLDTLDNMWIRTPGSGQVPLTEVAHVSLIPAASTIRRIDRSRNITITADVVDQQDPRSIVDDMLDQYQAGWTREYPGFKLATAGNLRTQAQFGDNFNVNFMIAFMVAFALFAIGMKSLFEPLLVLLALPFGFVGAVIGHLLLGHSVGLMSFMGFLACSGVVVNDNLVLLDRIANLRREGEPVLKAVIQAGLDRFRPIVLTSLTTFFGLLPILFEQSTQAAFLIPMAIALAFGVLFASPITLIFVPCAYLLGHLGAARARNTMRALRGRLDGLFN